MPPSAVEIGYVPIAARGVVVGLFAGMMACHAADAPERTSAAPTLETAQAGDAAPLCLSLGTSRNEALLGEPLTLAVTLTNCSDSPQRIRDLLAPEFGLLAVWMRRPGEKQEIFYRPAVRREGRSKPVIELAPREAVTVTVPVYFGPDGWNLPVPGAYSFRADYAIARLELHSDSRSVRIDAPKDGPSLESARQFMTFEAARFFYLEGGDSKGRDALVSIVRRHPDSPWASYAELALAIDSAASAKGAELTQTCARLETATKRVTDWLIAVRGYRALLACLTESGQRSRAELLLQHLTRSHPEANSMHQLRIP